MNFIFVIGKCIQFAWILFNLLSIKKMFRHYSRTILLSSRLLTKNLTIAPLNKFVTYKSIKPLSSTLLFNNNAFFFADLPKHQVLNVREFFNTDASIVTHDD